MLFPTRNRLGDYLEKEGYFTVGEAESIGYYYEKTELIEKYTTSSGLQAIIFHFERDTDEMTAVIYHNNIRYEFTITQHNDDWDSLGVFKAFLDTLTD